MAVTHTEVYRKFKGGIARHPLRFFPLFATELSVATRRKLPLILLYGPVAIATIVTCFIVYAKFALQAGVPDSSNLQAQLAVGMASSMLQVRDLILQVNGIMGGFALLAMVWYGSGLICEDRRAKAHLLYFSRPLTRLDYFLGKFCVAAFFGAIAVVVPNFVVCTMAVVTSPEWSFLKEQSDVIWAVFLFGGIWITTMSSLVLAISSLAPKRVFAMVGFFGLIMVLEVFIELGVKVGNVEQLQYLRLTRNLGVVGEWLFTAPGADAPEDVTQCALGVAAWVALSLTVLAQRLRRMELAS